MSSQSGDFENGLVRWIDRRLPVFTVLKHSTSEYPTPKNLNYWWNFGSLALMMLVIMLASGVFLAMNYDPNAANAFNSVEHIMRDVNYGWLLRYMHMNGASFFFLVVYIHIFRGIYYGSFKAPREVLWWIGLLIYLTMMATAFMGYVLPWGQMSFWGATVITNLFSALPFIGHGIVTWLWGGFAVGAPTLNRFYALHYLLAMFILALVGLHLWALHTVKSNNPLGIDPSGPQDTIPFHPYYTIKDLVGVGVCLLVYLGFVFFNPNFFGDVNNYIQANPLQTPPEITPEWYLRPYYAILRSVPDILFIPAKLAGVLTMAAAIILPYLLPWLDFSPVRSGRFRRAFQVAFLLFFLDCLLLGIVGSFPPEGAMLIYGRIATVYYLAFFLILLPLISLLEKPLPLPRSISVPVLQGRE